MENIIAHSTVYLQDNKSILLKRELEAIQLEFTERITKVRDKFFIEGKGLTVLSGNENFWLSFAIDFDRLKAND